MLEQDNSIPLYIQLKNIIKAAIDSEEITVGSKIPSEAELAEKYNVSRITVRGALSELVSEGYLVKKQGKGTYASRPKLSRPIEDVLGFTESCRRAGVESMSVVLKKEVIEPDAKLKDLLKLNDRDKVLYIQRLRFAAGEPLMLENNYYSNTKYGFLINEPLTGSLYDLLREKKGIDTCEALKTIISVTTASQSQAVALQTSIGAPLFVLDTLAADQNEEPVHYGLQYVVGEKYCFVRRKSRTHA